MEYRKVSMEKLLLCCDQLEGLLSVQIFSMYIAVDLVKLNLKFPPYFGQLVSLL